MVSLSHPPRTRRDRWRGQRRREHGPRLPVAVGLLCLATLTSGLALTLGTVMALSAASVVGVLCGWMATGLVHSELLLAWREGARDRARQAEAFRDLHAQASADHLAFAAVMSDRIAARDREIRELEGTLRLSEARACAAEARVRRESRRVDDARDRILELEVALAIRTAEEADALASWEPGGLEVDTVVDLLAWEHRGRATAVEAARADRERRERA